MPRSRLIRLRLLLVESIHKTSAKGVGFEGNLLNRYFSNGRGKSCAMPRAVWSLSRNDVGETRLTVSPAFFRARIIKTTYKLENKAFGVRPAFGKFNGGYVKATSPPSCYKFRGIFSGKEKNTRQGSSGRIFSRQFTLVPFLIDRSDGGFFRHHGPCNPTFDVLSGRFSHIFEVD